MLVFFVVNYSKISYKKWTERCEVNSKHPDWKPYCGIDYLEKDPKWFIDNGYGDYIGEQKLCPRCSDEHHYIHYSHTGFYPSYICPKCGRRWYANEDE